MPGRKVAYVRFDPECNYCTNPATLIAYYEDDPSNDMQVCDEHKTVAFS